MIIKTKNQDVIWNYLGIITSLGSQVILLPLLIKYVEPNVLGLWYIFVSIGAIVTLFDFGFNPTIARTVAYCWSGAKTLDKIDVKKIDEKLSTNYELLYFVIKTCKRLYLIISLIALFVMLLLGTWYIKHISGDIFDNIILFSWIIYATSIFFNLYIGYYSVALRGIGEVSLQNKANVISKLIFLFVGIIGLTLGGNIFILSLANLLSGFAMRWISSYFFYTKHKVKIKFKNIKFTNSYSVKYVFSKMWYNSWRDGLVSVNGYLITQANTLLCASFLSLAETGIYSFSLQVVMALMNIASGFYISCQPSLQSAYVNNNKALSKKLFSIAIFMYYFIFVLGVVIFTFVGIPIISFIKSSFIIDKYIFILLAINMLLIQRHRLSASFISNMNRLPYVKSFIISGCVTLFLSYIFMKYFNGGVYSLVIVPIIIQSIYNNWKWNNVVNSYLETNEFNLLVIGLKQIKHKLNIYKKRV